MARLITQLFVFHNDNTDRQYLMALTDDGKMWACQREIIIGNPNIQPPLPIPPVVWQELPSVWPTPQTPPNFVQITWVSTGNYLLGLKNDGTMWKCVAPAADPLVWTQVDV